MTENAPDYAIRSALGMYGEHNIFIGHEAGRSVTTGNRNILIGNRAGADLTTESDIIILGDDIRRPEDAPIRIGADGRLCVGATLFGEPFSLHTFLRGIAGS